MSVIQNRLASPGLLARASGPGALSRTGWEHGPSGPCERPVRGYGENRRGMLTIGLAGYEGGKMAELDSIDYLFVAPSSSVHRIQEAQTTIYQVLWELTVEEMSHVPRHTR